MKFLIFSRWACILIATTDVVTAWPHMARDVTAKLHKRADDSVSVAAATRPFVAPGLKDGTYLSLNPSSPPF